MKTPSPSDASPKTLFEKVWETHQIQAETDRQVGGDAPDPSQQRTLTVDCGFGNHRPVQV